MVAVGVLGGTTNGSSSTTTTSHNGHRHRHLLLAIGFLTMTITQQYFNLMNYHYHDTTTKSTTTNTISPTATSSATISLAIDDNDDTTSRIASTATSTTTTTSSTSASPGTSAVAETETMMIAAVKDNRFRLRREDEDEDEEQQRRRKINIDNNSTFTLLHIPKQPPTTLLPPQPQPNSVVTPTMSTNATNLYMYLPNLIVIGSPKCGTSSFSVWLFQRGKLKMKILKRHGSDTGGPASSSKSKQQDVGNNIFCGGKVFPKEPSFFSKEIHYFDIDERYHQGVAFYSQRFRHCHNQLQQLQLQQEQEQVQTTTNISTATMLVDKLPMYIMDGTPNYHQFPDRIAETYSNADADAASYASSYASNKQQNQKDQLKLILLLRHPVARILSWYNHMKNTLYQEYMEQLQLQTKRQEQQKQNKHNNNHSNNSSSESSSSLTFTYRTKYRYAIVTIQGNTIESSRELYLIRKAEAARERRAETTTKLSEEGLSLRQRQSPLQPPIIIPQQPSNLITTPLKFKTFHEYVVDIVIPLLETVDHTPAGGHTVPFDKYGYHISSWFRHFKSNQLLVLSYDEMITNPKKLQQRVNQYLGLNLLTDGIFPVVNTQDSNGSKQQQGGTGDGDGGRGRRDDTDTGNATATTTNVVVEDIVNGVLNPSKTKYPTCETFRLLLKYLQPELDLFYTIMNNLTITERPSMQPYPFPQFQIPKCI